MRKSGDLTYLELSYRKSDCTIGSGSKNWALGGSSPLAAILTHCPLFVAHGCLLTVLHCYHPPLPKAFIVAFCLCKTFNLPLDILYLDQFQIK